MATVCIHCLHMNQNKKNQNQRNRIQKYSSYEEAQEVAHGLLDAERDYALKVNALAERWFAMAKETRLVN